MQISYFAHSWLSDWNHGNAHFLRGLASALLARGHQVRAYEGVDSAWGGWSLAHLWQEPGGAAAVAQVRATFPQLRVRMYATREDASPDDYPVAARCGAAWVRDWGEELRGAEVVIVHEWNPPELVERLLGWRRRYGFRLILHDTHHRALSQPASLRRLPLEELDAVLAFSESLRRVYESWGVRRTYTLHEAADVEHFQAAPPGAGAGYDVAWVGNWGDEERTRELDEYLLEPVRRLGLAALVHGVRYPAAARARLAGAGIAYGGYLANLEVPRVLAGARLGVHIPRQFYVGELAGTPTIRVFEALACGQALVCAPWEDTEGLFQPGEDYWVAGSGAEMARAAMQLLADDSQRKKMGEHGAATVRARHSCGHRARQLEAICRDLG